MFALGRRILKRNFLNIFRNLCQGRCFFWHQNFPMICFCLWSSKRLFLLIYIHNSESISNTVNHIEKSMNYTYSVFLLIDFLASVFLGWCNFFWFAFSTWDGRDFEHSLDSTFEITLSVGKFGNNCARMLALVSNAMVAKFSMMKDNYKLPKQKHAKVQYAWQKESKILTEQRTQSFWSEIRSFYKFLSKLAYFRQKCALLYYKR